MTLINMVNFPVISDDRGSLISLEVRKLIPFEINRVYFLYGTQSDTSRGFHAHKALKQIAVCVSGKCRFVLDNGIERNSVWLDSPEKGLVIEDMTWREMHDFSSDCVLLVIASEVYDESDYIRDYDEFIKLVTS